MNGGQRAVMTRIHGLKHVQRFAAANLANHDAVRAHTKSVDYQFTLTNRALALHVRRTALQSDNVVLLHLQFRGVFDRNDSFPVGDETRQRIQQRGFAGARSAGDYDIEPRSNRAFE